MTKASEDDKSHVKSSQGGIFSYLSGFGTTWLSKKEDPNVKDLEEQKEFHDAVGGEDDDEFFDAVDHYD